MFAQMLTLLELPYLLNAKRVNSFCIELFVYLLKINVMTGFELFLISKGYLKYQYDFKTQQLILVNNEHIISTTSNLDYRYVHPSNPSVQIVYGLHEVGKPPTLIYPRPRILVKREGRTYNELYDDSMNLALQNESFDDILNAIFNRSILFEYIA